MYNMGRNVSAYHPAAIYSSHPQANFFGGFDDSLRAHAEALVAADISKNQAAAANIKSEFYTHHGDIVNHHRPQMLHSFCPGESMLEQMSTAPAPLPLSMSDPSTMGTVISHSSHPYSQVYNTVTSMSNPTMHPMTHTPLQLAQHTIHNGQQPPQELDCDPRDLEAFAEKFKQRRIKLGVTQCDVGNALGNLKLPGVGSLSQSTICRFESLTLSHNNMIALKPVLAAWLDEAERAANEKKENAEQLGVGKKRKRTSIASPEKRSLEAYFALQPRPSGEKIAQIADKLDLKKNVVRVWFCNQRQKQKRMKFSAGNN